MNKETSALLFNLKEYFRRKATEAEDEFEYNECTDLIELITLELRKDEHLFNVDALVEEEIRTMVVKDVIDSGAPLHIFYELLETLSPKDITGKLRYLLNTNRYHNEVLDICNKYGIYVPIYAYNYYEEE